MCECEMDYELCSRKKYLRITKDEINVPIALGAFRDKIFEDVFLVEFM